MLQAVDLTFAYTKTRGNVVDAVSLTIERGELVGILGPNGSGKTTLLKLLGGALTPLRGTVRLDGRPVAAWGRRDLARRVAYVPQETHAPFDFTVLEVALMGRFPHLGAFTLEGPDDVAIARRALAATGSSDLESRAFSTLSGGEKQRVVIASALAQSADLLLLDEPTASLDLGHRLDVQVLLQELNRAHGVTMAISTHDLSFAAALCRRLVLVRGGRVLAAGPTEEVLSADHVRALYDVEADVALHGRARHLVVTPIARSQAPSVVE